MTDNSELLNAIKESVEKQIGYFFEPAWKRNCGEMLKEESKFAKLVDFLQRKIDLCEKALPCFSPVYRYEGYSAAYYKEYRQLLGELAFLIVLKEHLLDNRTSEEMRANIEYTICKEYSVHYSEELKEYV